MGPICHKCNKSNAVMHPKTTPNNEKSQNHDLKGDSFTKTKKKCILKYLETASHLEKSAFPPNSTENPVFNKDDFFPLEILGKGGFGTVQKAYDKFQGKYVALKSFSEQASPEDEKDQIEQIQFEDYLLRKVEEINKLNMNYYFLKYYGILVDKTKSQANNSELTSSAGLVLQMESGRASLDDILRAGKTYSESEILFLAKTLINGFALLQKHGIAQRDVKPENVILVEEEDQKMGFLYKISDFGIGCEVPASQLLSCQTLTGISEKYVAPEVERLWGQLEEEPGLQVNYNPFLADVYSMGLVLVRLARPKFSKKVLQRSGFWGVLRSPSSVDQEFSTLGQILEKMLVEEPLNRWDFARLAEFIGSLPSQNFAKPGDEATFIESFLREREKKQSVLDVFTKHKDLFMAYSDKVYKLAQAEYHLTRAWELLERSRIDGTNDIPPEEEIHLLNLSFTLAHKEQDLEKAGHFLEKSDELGKRLIGNESYKAFTLYNFGLWYLEKSMMNEAIKSIEAALESYEKAKGQISAETALCYNLMGLVYLKKMDFEKTEAFFLKCLKIREKVYSEIHFHVAQSYINFGQMYRLKKNYAKSQDFYEKSLEILKKLYGENHLLCGNVCREMAMMFNEAGDKEKTAHFLQKSLEIMRNFNGEYNQATLKCYKDLGEFYRNDNPKLADDYFGKSRKLEQRLAGKEKFRIEKKKIKKKEMRIFDSIAYCDSNYKN